ncbi:steryl-sulfatase [Trichonephila clavata]|uniref:Steryl-sulfatase n=1 Tax=Trichonephila clavata TaxID=2740835 RepID=A0A8X6J8V3_TRICU|nr:steryl-sulfatase [Trichonephila clavata]
MKENAVNFLNQFTFCQILIGLSLPNFVIFLADDLGYGDVGCFGNYSIKTPNIDKLAANGVKLNHHLTAAAVCTPSRAALLTGRYPVRSGMESSSRNKVFFFVAASGGLPENEITIAKALKKKQYTTGIIGKWHLGNDCNKKGDGCHHPLNHGFDYFYGLPLSNFKDLGDEGESVITAYMPNFYTYFTLIPILATVINILIFRKFNFLFILISIIIPTLIPLFLLNLKTINGILMENKEVVEQPVHLKGLTQRLVHKARAFLDKQANEKFPFLLFIPFVHVHTALFCSDEFAGKSKHGRYGDNVEEMDWAVGQVMERLKSLGLYNNTFVYFSSDNGAHIEETGVDGQREGGFNGIFKGGKMMGGMEGGIRVPSIISWSGTTLKGEINYPTSQMDLFPTIMELADIPLPDDRIIDGKSMIPLLNGKSQSSHEFIFHYCGKQIHAATYIQQKDRKSWKIHWTTPKFKPGTNQCEYVCHCFGDFVIHHDPPLLYDLENDPSEANPINISSNSKYSKIIFIVEQARIGHRSKIEEVPDQFSFSNSIWKPWLQPCCNFPYCNCKDDFLTVS